MLCRDFICLTLPQLPLSPAPASIASRRGLTLSAARSRTAVHARRTGRVGPSERSCESTEHGVSFEEASELFRSGVDYLEILDGAHSGAEDRFTALVRFGVG